LVGASGGIFYSTANEKENPMQWTPEVVQAEIDYRQQTARKGVELEHLRAAQKRHRSVWRRLRWHHD
jgi:hypothetical protein